MDRRTVLASVGIALSTPVAGCLSSLDQSSEPSAAECGSNHELVNSSTVDPIETYQYEELSNEAKRAVEETVENGQYEISNTSQEPSEFRYWDETAAYDVSYQNETYRILTYTSMGCEGM